MLNKKSPNPSRPLCFNYIVQSDMISFLVSVSQLLNSTEQYSMWETVNQSQKVKDPYEDLPINNFFDVVSDIYKKIEL